MRTLIVSLVLIFGVVFVASSQAKREKISVEVYTTGDRGIFEYKPAEHDWTTNKMLPEFSVMHKLENGGSSGDVSGFITSATTVSYLDPDLKGLSRKNLSLLNGKEVVVIARLKQVGIGEGGQVYCEDLKILLVPIRY